MSLLENIQENYMTGLYTYFILWGGFFQTVPNGYF